MQDCRGPAPLYDPQQRAELRALLFAARHLFAEAASPLWDGRTGQDLLPLLLQACHSLMEELYANYHKWGSVAPLPMVFLVLAELR